MGYFHHFTLFLRLINIAIILFLLLSKITMRLYYFVFLFFVPAILSKESAVDNMRVFILTSN